MKAERLHSSMFKYRLIHMMLKLDNSKWTKSLSKRQKNELKPQEDEKSRVFVI